MSSTVPEVPPPSVDPDSDGLVGGGMDWFSDTLPNSKWRFRDGALLSRSEFSLLFSRIGTTYNVGGEAGTEFRLPNDAGRVTVGFDQADTDFDTLGETGGSKAALLAHSHTVTSHSHSYNEPSVVGVTLGGTNVNAGNMVAQVTGASAPATDSAGSGANSMPPYVVIRPIIKVM